MNPVFASNPQVWWYEASTTRLQNQADRNKCLNVPEAPNADTVVNTFACNCEGHAAYAYLVSVARENKDTCTASEKCLMCCGASRILAVIISERFGKDAT